MEILTIKPYGVIFCSDTSRCRQNNYVYAILINSLFIYNWNAEITMRANIIKIFIIIKKTYPLTTVFLIYCLLWVGRT